MIGALSAKWVHLNEDAIADMFLINEERCVG